jgi:phospholipid transport system transporter-binding protein
VSLELTLSADDSQKCTLSIGGTLDQQALKNDYFHSASGQDKKVIESANEWHIDLAKVERVDTAGLAWLINIAKYCAQNDVQLHFDNVPDKLLNLADLSGAKSVFKAAS